MPTILPRIGAGLILAAAAAAPAISASISAQGVAAGDETATVNRIDLDHVLIWTAIEFDPIGTEDPASPFSGLGGPCFGQVEVDGTSVSGGGYCTWTDGDGDSLTTRWTATGPGEESGLGESSLTTSVTTAGDWEALSGTGKWEGVTGGGIYRMGVEPTTGRHVNHLAGELTTP
jgi:hypothetical protein